MNKSNLINSHKEPWYFSNQIAVSSLSGCGRTTLLDNFKKHFAASCYRYVSAGETMRTIASGRGLSIEQHAANLCDNPNQGIDEDLDQCVADFGRQNYVIGEGRLLHITFPRAFKVRLVCDIDICAMRRSGQECGDEFEAVKAALIERNKNDCLRYDSIYGRAWNWPDLAFDCVLDTGAIGKDDMVPTIAKLHRDWCSRLGLLDRIFHDICHPTYRLDMNRLRIGN